MPLEPLRRQLRERRARAQPAAASQPLPPPAAPQASAPAARAAPGSEPAPPAALEQQSVAAAMAVDGQAPGSPAEGVGTRDAATPGGERAAETIDGGLSGPEGVPGGATAAAGLSEGADREPLGESGGAVVGDEARPCMCLLAAVWCLAAHGFAMLLQSQRA